MKNQFTKQELIAMSNAIFEHLEEIDKFRDLREKEIEYLKEVWKKINKIEASLKD